MSIENTPGSPFNPDSRDGSEGCVTTKITQFPNGNFRILLDSSKFFAINRDSAEVLGQTLAEVAAREPVTAYDYLRHNLGTLAGRYARTITVDQELVADADQHGAEVTRYEAERIIKDKLPNSYEGPFDVSVCIPPSEIDRHLGVTDEVVTVFELEVKPDNLTS